MLRCNRGTTIPAARVGVCRCVGFRFSANLIDTLRRIPISAHRKTTQGNLFWFINLIYPRITWTMCHLRAQNGTKNRNDKERSTREGGFLPCCSSDTAYGQTSWRANRNKIDTDKINCPTVHPKQPETWLPENCCCFSEESVDRAEPNASMRFVTNKGVTEGTVQGVSLLITDRQWIPSENTSNNRKQVALTQFWPELLVVCRRTSLERADPGPESPKAELLVGLLRLARGQPAPAPQN